MTISDIDAAEKFLRSVNYYRLSGYMLSLKARDQFYEWATFEILQDLYEFDRKLRIYLLQAIEHIEVALKTGTSYYIAHEYGPLAYIDHPTIFRNPEHHRVFIEKFKKRKLQSRYELFVAHHDANYGGKMPIWAAVELFTFGMLSKFFKNMRTKHQKAIAKACFGFYHGKMVNWLHVVAYVRNTCAHYGRLYNKSLPIPVSVSRGPTLPPNKLITALFVIKRLLSARQWSEFYWELEGLMEQYGGSIELDRIGFPHNWRDVLGV